MIIYLSGKYSGNIEENLALARKVAIELWVKGYAVLCPHLNTAHFEEDCPATYEDYIRGDLEMVAACDAVVMLPGWEQSNGARLERMRALLQLSKPVYHYPELPPIPERMTEEQELHLQAIKSRICQRIDAKYRKGQAEHGGNLWRKPVMQCLQEEVQDFVVYAHTLEDQINDAILYLKEGCVGWATNVLARGNAEGQSESD